MIRGIFIILLLIPIISFGQANFVWTNPGNGNWNVDSNWDQNKVPGKLDTVYILHDTVTIPTGYNAAADRIILGDAGGSASGLFIGSGGSLEIFAAAATDTGILVPNGHIQNEGGILLSNAHVGLYIGSTSILLNKGNLIVPLF